MPSASSIMNTSNETLSIIFMPNNGSEERNSGSNAQCIAQASEAVIPKASQLIFIFIPFPEFEFAKIKVCNFVAK